jgi:transcriptional regulator with XRE-family HTH domain
MTTETAPNPFVEQLLEYMHLRRVRPGTMATKVGVSAPFISAILSGRKAVSEETAGKIADALELDVAQREVLLRAAAISRRYLELPLGAPRSLYEAVHAIVDRASTLQPEQLQAIKLIAQLATNEASNEEREETPVRKMGP